MKTYYIIIIYIAFLGASAADAREVRHPLGRFSKDDSAYDYRRVARPESSVGQEEITQMQAKGGLIIKGFPEGCAYANIDEPLPDHILGYGRIDFMGSSWAFEYRDQRRPGPFATAEVAANLGLMGQNPEQNLSVDLMSRTADDRFVIAQLLDRSDLGLPPIVTCISPVFLGTLTPGRSIVFGQDYWTVYDRFRKYRLDSFRRERSTRWRHRWKEDEEYNWRKAWPERRDGRVRDRHYGHRPRPPVLIPRPEPHKDYKDKDEVVTRPRPFKKPRPDRPSRDEPHKDHKDKDEVITRPLPTKKPKPEPDRPREPKEPKVDVQVPAGDKGRKERIHIQLPAGDKGRKERIHIQLPAGDKGRKERMHIQLPAGDKGRKERMHIQLPAGDKGRKERIPIQLPEGDEGRKRSIHIHLPDDTSTK